MEPVIYRRRRNALSRSEREWRVEDDALVTRGGSGVEKRYPWTEFVSIRLCSEPARFRPWRYVCELQPRDRRKIVIDNAHWSGPRCFENRSNDYAPFVRAIIARLAAVRPAGTVLIGETPKRYFLLLMFALLGLGGLAFVLIAAPTPIDATPYAAAIKFAIILLMLPVFWRWVLRAMPRGVPFTDVPDRAMPPGQT